MLLHVRPLSLSGLIENTSRSIADRLVAAKQRLTTHEFYPPKLLDSLMTKAAVAAIPVVVGATLMASEVARATRT